MPPLAPPAPELADNGSNSGGSHVNWRLGGAAAPLYAYRNLESAPAEFSVMADNASESVENKEAPVLSYSVALTTAMDISKRLSFHSGLQYARMGQSTNNPLVQYRFGSGSKAFTSAGMIIFNEQGNTEISNKGFLAGDSHYSGELLQLFDYLEVPLIASYKIVDQRLDLSMYAGMSAGVLVGNRAWFIDKNGNKLLAGYTYELNRLTYGGVAGLGIEYPVFKKVNLSLQPGVRYMFRPLNDYSSLGNHPYSFTMNTGLQYRFGSH